MRNISEKEFNLLDEPWVKVMQQDTSIKTVSLPDAIIHAHEYSGLAGEMRAQDITILRLMEAILITAFYKVDVDGNENPIETPDNALDRWEDLWKQGKFPEAVIRNYLSQWHERFWLFHPERPFMQSLNMQKATQNKASKLIGNLSKSGNVDRLRLFVCRTGEEAESVSYAEAARWLLFLNAFDDCAVKVGDPKAKARKKGVSRAYLGPLGMIYPKGKTLFETLMLNMKLLTDKEEIWEENRPVWEEENPRDIEQYPVACPNNLPDLYTFNSRLILLHREKGRVTGYSIKGGSWFDTVNAFTEPMTLWQYSPENKKKGQSAYWFPQSHMAEKQLWRDFNIAFVKDTTNRRPGSIEWIEILKKNNVLDRKKYTSFQAVGIRYDVSQSSSITDSIDDVVTLHTTLLGESVNEGWRRRIAEEIATCDKISRELYFLTKNSYLAAGANDSIADTRGKKSNALWYDAIDQPFRKWLRSLSPNSSRADGDNSKTIDQFVEEWQKSARTIALKLGREMVDQAGEKAYFGRIVKEKSGSKIVEKRYSSAKSFSDFCHNVYANYPKITEVCE